MFASLVPTRKSALVVLCVLLICVASFVTNADQTARPEVLRAGDAPPAALMWGGFMNFTLSPACLRAVVVAAVSCSQVGLAGLAGCGVLVHLLQGVCW